MKAKEAYSVLSSFIITQNQQRSLYHFLSNSSEAGDILLSTNSRNSHERGNTFNTARTDDSSAESIEQLKATIVYLNESINHLKEVNKELSTKYDKQKEFISIDVHEL